MRGSRQPEGNTDPHWPKGTPVTMFKGEVVESRSHGAWAAPAPIPVSSQMLRIQRKVPPALLTPVFLLLAGCLTGQAAAAQETAGSGTVSGFVFDSTRAVPLDGATVVLWETAFKTTSNAEGLFDIEDVPAGEYTVVFFHPRLQYLGIGSGRGSVLVRPDQESSVALTTPSMPTILQTECLLEDRPDQSVIALGYVSDSRSGVPMAGAKVTMRWSEQSGRARQVEATAGPEGWFRSCALPPGAQVAARASFLNMSSTRREVETGAEAVARLDFLLGEYSASRATGTLVDQLSGEPVQGAEVRLEGTNHFTVSDAAGLFEITGVEPGEYTLTVSHLAYPTRREKIDFGSDLGHHLQIAMAADAIELEPIVVTVEQNQLSEQLAMGGQLITAADVERVRRRSHNLADVLQLQRVSGLQVTRTAGQLCAQFSSGQVRLLKRRACESVMVYIDNARVADPTTAMDIPADAIDRMVVFRPVEAGALFGTGAAHGVIMIYTKSGKRRIR